MIILRVLAPIINILPEGIVRFIGSKTSDYLLNKYTKIEITGKEILDDRIGKPTIFISNHLSNVDGIILNKMLQKNNITFMAGKKLNANPLTAIFLKTVKYIPISPNTADRSAIKKAFGILKMGESILIFPEGTRSRSGAMIKGKKGFVLLAKLSKAEIVPIALEGTERLLPVNQKDMGQETPRHAVVKVTIGKPFRLEENHDVDNWEDECLDLSMRKIAQMLKPEYQGVYGDTEQE